MKTDRNKARITYLREGDTMNKGRAQCLITKGNKILMVKHNQCGIEYFCLPGGGIEDGETPENAAARERQGIGKRMIGILEEKARAYGYKQIRAWSSQDKVEALNMWYSLNYCMCPAAMLGQSIAPGFENH